MPGSDASRNVQANYSLICSAPEYLKNAFPADFFWGGRQGQTALLFSPPPPAPKAGAGCAAGAPRAARGGSAGAVCPSLPPRPRPAVGAGTARWRGEAFLFGGCDLKAPRQCPRRPREACCSQWLARLHWGVQWGRCWRGVIRAPLWGSQLGSRPGCL